AGAGEDRGRFGGPAAGGGGTFPEQGGDGAAGQGAEPREQHDAQHEQRNDRLPDPADEIFGHVLTSYRRGRQDSGWAGLPAHPESSGSTSRDQPPRVTV